MVIMNIIYGICSDGLGHATRSMPIIDHLLKKGHNVYIVTGKEAKDFLSEKYKNIIVINSLAMAYGANEVKQLKTVVDYFASFKTNPKNYRIVKNLIKKVKPDIIISDFETTTITLAKIYDIPCIAIDNHSAIFRTYVEFKMKDLTDLFIAKMVGKLRCYRADWYLALCFYKPKLKKARTEIFDPILREEFYKIKPKYKNYVLVYNRFQDKNNRIIKELKKVKNETFYVYGLNQEKIDGNVILKKTGNNIKELANCKAVICNGGHSLISEAIFLKKPIYSLPVKNQFEQQTNAYYLQKMGFGENHKTLTSTEIRKFLKKINIYKKNLEKHKYKDKKIFFNRLDKLMIDLAKKNAKKKALKK